MVQAPWLLVSFCTLYTCCNVRSMEYTAYTRGVVMTSRGVVMTSRGVLVISYFETNHADQNVRGEIAKNDKKQR